MKKREKLVYKFAGGLVAGGVGYSVIQKKDIPAPVKILIPIVSAGIGFAVTGQLLDLLEKDEDEKPYDDAIDANKTELEILLKNNIGLPPTLQQVPSYTPAVMKDYANKLFTAMDGAGTDIPAVETVFSAMNNQVDILNLIEAFGTRAGTSMFATSTKSDLQDWLASDGATNAVNAILETKTKITKRF